MQEVVKDEVVLPGAVFVMALVCYHAIYSVFFPNHAGMLGHDYSLVLPVYFDGAMWFHNNSILDVPWFTPSFCGGQPFFSDPQSSYYSLFQWLSFFLPPMTAMYGGLLVVVSVGYWGMYFLCRRVFGLGVWVAVFAAVVIMFNGFIAHRHIIGHIGFHGLMLVPWITLLLVSRKDIAIPPLTRGGNILLAGLMVAYWFQSGMGSLIIPASFAVLILCATAGVKGLVDLHIFVTRAAMVSVVALGLSISKLMAGFSFLSHFPRSGYQLPGIESFMGSVEVAFRALAFSSQAAHDRGAELIVNQQLRLGPHEWSYGLTIIPILICLLGLGLFIYRFKTSDFRDLTRAVSLAIIAIVLLIPIALNVFTPEWNTLLKETPFIGSSSSLFRWYLIYIPFVALASALSLAALPLDKKFIPAIVGVAAVVIVGLKAFEDRTYYFADGASYPAETAIFSWQFASEANPRLGGVGIVAQPAGLVGNNVIFAGMSQLYCYNPVFGYSLENLPIGSLKPGPVGLVENDRFNIKNPACYVFSEENSCVPGDHFSTAQVEQAENFISYRPVEFEKPLRQKIANVVTQVTLAGVFILLLMLIVGLIREQIEKEQRETGE